MILCQGCNKIYDDNICQVISKFVICCFCYNFHNQKLIPIIYDKNDNIIHLKSLQTEYNLLEHADLLIHFSKKQIY
jgi:hypothetical protein